MKWEKSLLGDIIEIKKGQYITKKDAVEGPYPVILGGQEPAYYIDKYNHTGKAIVISRSGASAGYVSLWNEPIFVTDGFLVEGKPSVVDLDFLYFLLKLHQSELQGLQGGSAIPHVTPSIIKSIEVYIPSLDKQKTIVSILSAYNNLIENNQRQIKLLEEAAQRLYREWFVDLRFPEHESVRIVDGVPEGWEYRAIFSFGEIITGKTPSTEKKEYYGGNVPFIKIPDMHNVIFPMETEVHLSETGANSQNNKNIPPNSLLVSCIATVGLVNISTEICQTNQQINSLILHDNKDLYFMYFTLLRLKELLEGVGSNGATMTNVNKSKFGSIQILYPTDDLIRQYYILCDPIFRKIKTLSKTIIRLIEVRDLFLAKLMSGEWEV